MSFKAFSWERFFKKISQTEWKIEFLVLAGLLLAALGLYVPNLGNLPLRDWDEATVAQVAKEIWLSGKDRWLFPELWGDPYLNKPPLIHLSIAGCYALFGANEWAARLPGALLSSISVPLLYATGREIFGLRTPALFSAGIYLTLLPVVRHGRLAMLDGAVVCFTILTIWCVLKSRRDRRWGFAVGVAWGMLCLSKGIIALLGGAIAVLFLWWDTPRLLGCKYFWCGSMLGSTPAIAWYLAQWFRYRQDFIQTNAIAQSFQRISVAVEGHGGPIWYYLLEILKYSLPWLLFSLWGMRLAWRNRNWGWAKLILVWAIVYLAVVSGMQTKLPWYIMPIYPALSLAGGAQLAETFNLPSNYLYPRVWAIGLGVLSTLATLWSIYLVAIDTSTPGLLPISAALALTFLLSAISIARRSRQFIWLLFWGMYVSLALFVNSPYWNWELNEAYPVKPVAATIAANISVDRLVYTSFDYERPSLNFYSGVRVIPAAKEKLLELWEKSPSPYLLLDASTWKQIDLDSAKILATAPGWVLVTKSTEDLFIPSR